MELEFEKMYIFVYKFELVWSTYEGGTLNNFSNILVSLFQLCTMKLPIDTWNASRAFQIYQKSFLASEHVHFFFLQKLQNMVSVGKKPMLD